MKLLRRITPLSFMGLLTLSIGLWAFTYDPGEEGWGTLAAMMICLFSIPPLLLDWVLKRFLKRTLTFWLLQIVLALLTLWLYWKWELIII